MMHDEFFDEPDDSQATHTQLDGLDPVPVFQSLFMETVSNMEVSIERRVLFDFGRHVVGPISDQLGHLPAKGGNFFREREAEGMQNTQRFQRDQTMRAHLINGALPTLRIGTYLAVWEAFRFRAWDEAAIRLFMAGYVLHDFAKLPEVQKQLEDAGFKPYATPDEAMMPTLEDIFRGWGTRLGLYDFLEPVGGFELLLHDLIYVAVNTQVLKGTASKPALFTRPHLSKDALLLATEMSRMADLIAYVAPDPRSFVSHKTLRLLLNELSEKDGKPIARFTYHHVAENRGLLLNFIHDGVLEQLTIEGSREPLLYAPSGVVYLEHRDAPAMPDKASLVDHIVEKIRREASAKLVRTGKGAKRGNVGLQTSDIYNDFMDLREFVQGSPRLVERLITNKKSHERLGKLEEKGLPGSEDLPRLSEDPGDARVDRLAEWAALMERVFRDRLGSNEAITLWLLEKLNQSDRLTTIQAMRDDKRAAGGIYYWWFWVAGHVIADTPQLSPDDVMEHIEQLASDLIQSDLFPDELPASA